MDIFDSFFPHLPLGHVVFLIVSAGCTSLLTAAFGIGGGVMLIGLMAQILPPQLIIPLHGVVQLGSNAGRAAMSWKHIRWSVLLYFIPGAVIGACLGYFLLISLSPRVIYLSIAGFILYLCWGPALPKKAVGRLGTWMMAIITTFLTIFIGATGPLVGAFIKQLQYDRFCVVATFAAAMTVQHALKLVVFEQANVNILEWVWLLVGMVLSGFIGTWIGLTLLKKMPEASFQRLFSLVLTALALRLIWQALAL